MFCLYKRKSIATYKFKAKQSEADGAIFSIYKIRDNEVRGGVFSFEYFSQQIIKNKFKFKH